MPKRPLMRMVLSRGKVVLGPPGFQSHLKKEEIRVILDTLTYLWYNYDKDNRRKHFSASRATKMIFLVDWNYAHHNKENWKQATAIRWFYNVHGPYVDLIPILGRRFKIDRIKYKLLFKPKEEKMYTLDSLNENIKEMSEIVIKDTQTLAYFDFMDYVYDTPAVKLSRKREGMDISKIAEYCAEV